MGTERRTVTYVCPCGAGAVVDSQESDDHPFGDFSWRSDVSIGCPACAAAYTAEVSTSGVCLRLRSLVDAAEAARNRLHALKVQEREASAAAALRIASESAPQDLKNMVEEHAWLTKHTTFRDTISQYRRRRQGQPFLKVAAESIARYVVVAALPANLRGSIDSAQEVADCATKALHASPRIAITSLREIP